MSWGRVKARWQLGVKPGRTYSMTQTDPALRYHGLASEMPPDVKLFTDRLFGVGVLDGHEIVTVGPSDVDIEFPLPDYIAKFLNQNRSNHARPRGCRDAYIYGLRANGRYFYVGSTIHNLRKRLSSHKSDVRNGRNLNRRFTCHLASVIDNVEISLIDTVAEAKRFEREYEVINEFLAKGIPLLNSQLAHKIWPRKVVVSL